MSESSTACSLPVAVCVQKFADIERRLDSLEKAEWRTEIKEVSDKVTNVQTQLANLNGRLAGYLAAGGILGAILSAVVQYVLKKGGTP